MFRSSTAYHRLWYIKRRNAPRIYMLARLAALSFVIFMLLLYFNSIVFPSIQRIIEAGSKEMINEAVTAALQKESIKGEDFNRFVTISRDSSGRITAVQVDYTELNGLSGKVSRTIKDKLEPQNGKEITVPASVLVGESIFSTAKPGITMKIFPVGNVESEFRTQFVQVSQSHAIQKITLRVKAVIGIGLPLMEKKMDVFMEIPVAEVAVIGNVPMGYTSNNN